MRYLLCELVYNFMWVREACLDCAIVTAVEPVGWGSDGVLTRGVVGDCVCMRFSTECRQAVTPLASW